MTEPISRPCSFDHWSHRELDGHCVLNDDLRTEWEEYLEQTTRHEQVMTDVLTSLGLDPETETSGRQVVRAIGERHTSSTVHPRRYVTEPVARLCSI